MKKQSFKRKTKKKIALIAIAVLIFSLLAVGGVFGKDVLSGTLRNKTVEVKVSAGAGTIEVAQILKDEGVIANQTLFELYAAGKGYDSRWQQGTFTVTKGMGYADLCTLLTTPRHASVKVTIPEGKQARQIAKILEEAGICSADAFMDAADHHNFGYDFLEGIDHVNPLEGYLFPDTYYFEKNTDPDEVINAMLTAFGDNVYLDQYIGRAEALGYSFNDIVILSSIVESEATTTADRKTVAGVFFNRLNAGGRLQSCVTVEYALGVKKSIISMADTKVDSPYNTYLYAGLPIGPICCPGLDSIKATLNYAKTDYYYFQSDKNGKLYFAVTYADHAALQKQLQANWKGEVIADYNQ